jgi:CRP-like cAMP-binding protein
MAQLILDNIAKHIELEPNEAEYFLSLLKETTIKKNGFLLHSGDVAKTLNFVSQGCLRLYKTDADGKDHILLFAPEGWWCTDSYSFYTQSAAEYTIDALEDTICFQITSEKLELLYKKVPKFERFFRILFQNGFIMYQRRITANTSLPAEKRYHRFKFLYPKLEQRIAQKHIASYLGITPVFLSRLRKRNG